MRDYLSYGIAVFVVCERFTFCILCGRNALHCAQLFLCSFLLLCSTCKSTLTKGCHIFTCIIESHWLLTDGQAFLSKLEIFEFSCFGWSPAVCHVITEIPMLDFFLGGGTSHFQPTALLLLCSWMLIRVSSCRLCKYDLLHVGMKMTVNKIIYDCSKHLYIHFSYCKKKWVQVKQLPWDSKDNG